MAEQPLIGESVKAQFKGWGDGWWLGKVLSAGKPKNKFNVEFDSGRGDGSTSVESMTRDQVHAVRWVLDAGLSAGLGAAC